MSKQLHLESAKAMESAFRVHPEAMNERAARTPLGVYSWRTPPMESFSLPETGDLVIALHLGGSRQVRAITHNGLSRSVSTPGLITVLAPRRTAAFRTDGSISLVTLHVPHNMLAREWVEPVDSQARWTSSQFAFRDAYACASMEALLRVTRRRTPPSPDYVGKLGEALLCHLGNLDFFLDTDEQHDSTTTRLGHAPLDSMIAYIEGRISTKLSVDDLARQSGLSRASFNRGFKQLTGLSFHQYLVQRRIDCARRMLLQTKFDLAYIAQETGFANQSHFTSAFKAAQNCTPREFRNGH